MSPFLIAVPSRAEGGLDAERSPHFGRSPAFTLVDLEGGIVGATRVIANVRHTEGGHGRLADVLLQAGVTDVVTIGVGAGMLGHLKAAGIRVWVERDAATVREAVEALIDGEAQAVEDADSHRH